MKRLLDLQCTNKECTKISLDVWATSEDVESYRAGRVVCDECHSPLQILLGRPQFVLKGDGYYDNGRH